MRQCTRLSLVWALVCCAVCHQHAGAQQPAGLKRFVKAADAVRENDLRADLTWLASDAMKGRNTPSPELDRAAEGISRRMKLAGLSPAFAGRWFQGPHRGDASKASLSLTWQGASVTLSADALRSPGGGTQVKQVLAVRPMTLARRRQELPSDLTGSAVLLRRRDQRGARRALFSNLRWLQGLKIGALLVPPSLQASARLFASRPFPVIFLPKALEGDGPGRLELSIPIAERPWARNVGGLLRGSDPALEDEVIAFTAHYDHIGWRPGRQDGIYNGADDDGTGSVSVLAIARAMCRLKPAPKRTTLFVLFYGEEKGLLGSRFYTEHPALPLARTRCVFNIEMVGRPDDIEKKSAWVTGWGQSDFGSLIVTAGRAAGVTFYENKRGQLSRRLFSASDNLSFARVGVPAHSISAGSLHDDYHQPGDEVSKIDFQNMTQVARAIFVSGAAMADGGKVPTWTPDTRWARAAAALHKKR